MTYQVIARKWRPQTFADLVGQEHVTETLGNAIKKDRVAHAYIFSGARGVGKTTAARILAKALNCVNGPTAEPCGVCDSCKEIAAGSSLDVIEIDAASNRGIDQIRELREMVRYAPAASRSKVVILDEAHMLTGEASNALLKTLEEPPERVIFVMATTQPEDLEDTIRSRSQHFHFRALTFNEITDRLKYIASKENLKIDDGALAVIARMAEGSMRDALSLLEQARAYCGDDIKDQAVRDLLGVVPEDALNELVQAIAERSAERALGLVHRFQKEGRNLQHFCREAIRHMRNLLIARVCGADSDLLAATPDQRPGLAKAAALFSEEDLTRYFQILLQTDDSLRRAMDPRVHLEMGLLRLVNAARLAPLEELLSEAKSAGGANSGGGAAGRNSGVSSALPSRSASAGAVGSSGVASAIGQKAPASLHGGQAEGGRYKIEELGETRPSAFGMSGAGAAAAPAFEMKEKTVSVSDASGMAEGAALDGQSAQPGMAVPQAAAARATKEKVTEVAAAGMNAAQVAEIKAGIQAQQKFIGELLEHSSRWELDGAELRIYFPAEKSTFAGLIEGRDTLEKIRGVSGKVLGRAVRVCAKLETGAAKDANASRAASSTQEIRAQFENDPMVKSMLQRFGGRISGVRRQGEE
ncbi:MAG TPA: DNA polymerase III subunit gamma/tau [Candidatus Acidoferrales bacterium]|jgi:DNA polymerase-3 subunit gamma/tau|nr:DNA polymerase III subunit gamma/tau [Candidatus Acidoferrales bacterium]